MVDFHDDEQQKQLHDIREDEQERLAQILSEKYDLPYIDLTVAPVSVDALRTITEEEAREAGVAAFDKHGGKLKVAVQSPNRGETQQALDELREKNYQLEVYMASQQSLEHVWDRYEDLSYTTVSERGTLDIEGEEVTRVINEVSRLDDVKEKVQHILETEKGHRVSRVVEMMIAGALALDASDIHIEPREDDVRLRYRLDGVLTDILTFDNETFDLLASRIKLLSGLKLNVSDEAQDGRFSINVGEDDIEIRSSALPGPYGESLVMRVLNPNALGIPLEELGIHPRLLEVIKQEINRPNGMILTTGPTGSGKTTTLYAFLKRIYNPDIKIITIENPIEYHITGIVQTQVDAESGYTFLEGLRSSLRQDPDVIMVGEIRGNETATTAINAALTGHLVFSTLHTNTAAGAFPRLLSLGVNAKVLTSAINIALAQRLVRKLCPDCSKKRELTGDDRERVERVLEKIVDESYLEGVQTEHVWTSEGCETCSGTGYTGRVGVYEGILTDKQIEEVVQQNPSEREIREAAKDQRLLTMSQDGVLKVLNGTTSLDELERVIDLDEM